MPQRKFFIVLGLGSFGSALAEQLHKNGCRVTGVDANRERVENMKDVLYEAVVGDVTDRDTLRRVVAGSLRCRVHQLGREPEHHAVRAGHAALPGAGRQAGHCQRPEPRPRQDPAGDGRRSRGVPRDRNRRLAGRSAGLAERVGLHAHRSRVQFRRDHHPGLDGRPDAQASRSAAALQRLGRRRQGCSDGETGVVPRRRISDSAPTS